MLIRRKLPPGPAAIGLLLVMGLAAAFGRRAASIVGALQAGLSPIPVEIQTSPGRAVCFGAEVAISLLALPTAFGVFRFHKPSRRALILLLLGAVCVLLYKSVRSASCEEYRFLIPYGAALAGILVFLFAFNRSDVVEMYQPAWEGHDIPVLPLPAWAPAAAALAGFGVGGVLHRLHDGMRAWLIQIG